MVATAHHVRAKALTVEITRVGTPTALTLLDTFDALPWRVEGAVSEMFRGGKVRSLRRSLRIQRFLVFSSRCVGQHQHLSPLSASILSTLRSSASLFGMTELVRFQRCFVRQSASVTNLDAASPEEIGNTRASR